MNYVENETTSSTLSDNSFIGSIGSNTFRINNTSDNNYKSEQQIGISHYYTTYSNILFSELITATLLPNISAEKFNEFNEEVPFSTPISIPPTTSIALTNAFRYLQTASNDTKPTKITQLLVVPISVESINLGSFSSSSSSSSGLSSDSSVATTESTNDLEEFYSVLSFFFTFVMVIMCISGVFMNIVSLWIFTRRAFRQRSINVLLAGLSASDMCLCFLAIPVFSLNQLQKIFPGLADDACNEILLYAYPITLMAQTSSVWMLVGITVDRYLAVCHPFAVRIYCTTTRAIITIVCCVTFSIGYNFVRFWEYTIDNSKGAVVGLLRENPYYMVLYQNIAMLLTQFILPLSVLGFLNLQVAKAILEAGETRRELVISEQREHRTAKMMLFVVIVFLFCYILSFCLNLLEIFNAELFKRPIGFLLNDVNNVLVVFNSSSSFIFYTKYSSRYRSQLHVLKRDISWAFFRYCCLFVNVSNHEHCNKNSNSKKDPRKYSSVTIYSGVMLTTSTNLPTTTIFLENDDTASARESILSGNSRKISNFVQSLFSKRIRQPESHKHHKSDYCSYSPNETQAGHQKNCNNNCNKEARSTKNNTNRSFVSQKCTQVPLLNKNSLPTFRKTYSESRMKSSDSTTITGTTTTRVSTTTAETTTNDNADEK